MVLVFFPIYFQTLLLCYETVYILVAEQFRKDFPEYFQTLATTPVRFQKMHVKDGRPELMVHHRPHIKLNHRNEIISTTWSPANEGPLKNLPDEQVEKYYEAYLEYSKAINTSSSIVSFFCSCKVREKPFYYAIPHYMLTPLYCNMLTPLYEMETLNLFFDKNVSFSFYGPPKFFRFGDFEHFF